VESSNNEEFQTEVQKSQPAPAPAPPAPANDELDVNTMKVSELRKQLQERQLDYQGLKRTLQLRLQTALDEEQRLKQVPAEDRTSDDAVDDVEMNESIEEEEVFEETNDFVIEEKEVFEETNDFVLDYTAIENDDCAAADDDASMADVAEADRNSIEFVGVVHAPAPMPHAAEVNNETRPVETAPEFSDVAPTKSPKKKTFGRKLLKATTKLFSPTKCKNSPVKEKENVTDAPMDDVTVQNATSMVDDVQSEGERNSSAASDLRSVMSDQSKTGSMACDVPIEEISKVSLDGTNEFRSDSSSTAQSLVSSSSNNESKQQNVLATPAVPIKMAGKIFSSSTAQAKKKQMDEARKERLEKIRNKVWGFQLCDVITLFALLF